MRYRMLLLINIFIVLIAFKFNASEYLKDGYEFKENRYEDIAINGITQPLDYTLNDASGIVKSGNPLDLVVAYKEYTESIGETINPDEFEHDFVMGDLGEWEDDEDDSIGNDLTKVSLEIEENLSKNVIPTNDNIEYNQIKSELNNFQTIIVVGILLVIFIVLFALKRNKIFIILCLLVLLYEIYSVLIVTQVEDKYNHIENYILNGVIDNHLSKKIEIDYDDKFKADFINKYSRDWDANVINGYLMSLNYCNKFIKNNEDFPTIYKFWEDDGWLDFDNKSYYSNYDEFKKHIDELYSDNRSPWQDEKVFVEDVPLLNYENERDINERIDIRIHNKLDYYEIKKVYENINNDKSDKVIFLDDLQNKLTELIPYHNWEDNYMEELYKYIRRVWGGFDSYHYNKYFDNQVISYFKDWYINGESRNIELPYGVVFSYKAPEFVKKDIKEIVYTNERELDHDSTDKQVYVMYYKDSEGKLGASYCEIEFKKTGNNYEMYFNPIFLMYNLNKPIISLEVK